MRLTVGLFAAMLAPVATAAHADARSDAILRTAFAKIHGARSLTAEMSAMIEIPGVGGINRARTVTVTGTVAAMKPNFLRVEVSGRYPGARPIYFVSDGKAYYSNFLAPPNAYRRQPVLTHPTEFGGVWEGEIDAFFGGPANASKATTSYGGTEKVGGVECDIVRARMRNPDRTVVYAIGRADHLIHRTTMTARTATGTQTMTDTLTNIRFDVPLKPNRFAFKPPAGTRPPRPPSGGTWI